MDLTQEKTVLEIVLNYPLGIRTEEVKIIAMRKGISCADRFLRWLQSSGKIKSERLEGDRTKTWYPAKVEETVEQPKWKELENGQMDWCVQ